MCQKPHKGLSGAKKQSEEFSGYLLLRLSAFFSLTLSTVYHFTISASVVQLGENHAPGCSLQYLGYHHFYGMIDETIAVLHDDHRPII